MNMNTNMALHSDVIPVTPTSRRVSSALFLQINAIIVVKIVGFVFQIPQFC